MTVKYRIFIIKFRNVNIKCDKTFEQIIFEIKSKNNVLIVIYNEINIYFI